MKGLRLLLAALVVAILQGSMAVAQVPDWVHTWGGGGDETGVSIAADPSGFVYVSGMTNSAPGGDPSLLLMKYSLTGENLWVRAFDWGSGSMFARISLASNGDLLLCGGTNDNSDAAIARFDGDGSPVWARLWNNNWEDANGKPITDPQGNIYVCKQTNVNAIDAILSKYDANGTLQWSQQWNRQSDNPAWVARDQSGNIFVTGYSGDWSWTGNQDVFLLKYDANGTLLWDRVWTNAREAGFSLATAADGSVYITGLTSGFGAGGDDVLLLKFDGDGNLAWETAWGGDGYDVGQSVALGADGHIYVTGSTASFGAGGTDALILKFDLDGSLISSFTWGSSGDENGHDVVMSGAGVYLSGNSPSVGGSWQEVTGIESMPTGTVSPGPGVSTVFAGGTDSAFPLSEVTFTGTPDNGGGGADALILKILPCGPFLPFDPADLDCNGFIDAIDLAQMIDVVFFGAPIPQPCFVP